MATNNTNNKKSLETTQGVKSERLRDKFKNRRESTNVIDARLTPVNPIIEGIRRVPAVVYQTFTGTDEYDLPNILKTPRMKELEAINKKYSLKGKQRLRLI